jgi:S-adenosylmethionine decarboxylase
MGNEYKSPPVGQEISCVMKGIRKDFLLNGYLKKILESVLDKQKFTILKKIYYDFSSDGFTALILLAESHLAVHTYPEYNSVYVNMYSCRGLDDAKPVYKFFKEKLKPKKILFYHEDKIPVKD